MKKIPAAVFILAVLSAAAGICHADTLSGKENSLRREISGSVLVKNIDKAVSSLSGWVSDNGGYILVKSSDRIAVRFPSRYTENFRDVMKSVSEEILEFSLEASDIEREIIEYQSGIKAREEILRRNMSYIDNANVSGTIGIEKEVTALIREIERLKGRLNRALTERDFTRADISFNFAGQSIPSDIRRHLTGSTQ